MPANRIIIHIVSGFLTVAGFWASVALLICALVGWLAWLPFWIALAVFIVAGIVMIGNFAALVRDGESAVGLRRRTK